MEAQPADPRRESLARALVVLHRYSLDISEIAVQSLGQYDVENRDIEMILTVHRNGPVTPTEMAARMAAPRSTVSRAMTRLQATGLVVRIPDEQDRRSVRIALTPRGRRRVAALSTRLGDYFAHAEPLLKEAFHLVGAPVPVPDPAASADPIEAARAMSATGAQYVEEAVRELRPFGISETSDRFTIALLQLQGNQRPTRLAEELGLTPSGVSGVLTRLEQASLITRRHDTTPGDRRAVVVELTPLGARAADVQLDTFARHAPVLVSALSLTWAAGS